MLVDEADDVRARFFSVLSLLVSAALVVVLAANLPTLYLGWEGVWFCTVLLIGVVGGGRHREPAGARAFIVGRLGAAGFLLVMAFAFYHFGTLELEGLRAAVAAGSEADLAVPATVVSLLLFVGVAGISAQVPFQVWLPGAASARTPASALIQSVAMVAAGAFVLVRYGFFVIASPSAMLTIAVVGGVTAVFAGVVSLVQYDIGEVLSHATVSQLGVVFLGLGVGAVNAATLHLIAIAPAMACLVLGSGLVMRAFGGQRHVFEMGGLRKIAPTILVPFLAAAAVVAAVPPMAVFISRCSVLTWTFEAGLADLHSSGRIYFLLWALGLLSTALVAGSLARLVILVFFGDFRGEGRRKGGAADPPLSVRAPFVGLALLSVVAAAVVGLSDQLSAIGRWFFVAEIPKSYPLVGGIGAGIEWVLTALTAVTVLWGISVAVRFYLVDSGFVRAEGLARRFSTTRKLLIRECWFDTLFELVVGKGPVALAHGLDRIDRRWIDGVVNGVRHTVVGVSWLAGIFDRRFLDRLVDRIGGAVEMAGFTFRRLQVGFIQGYVMVMVFGAALLLGIVFVVNL
jgi:NADH-quinone oxidoreductase subunit L